LSILLYNIFLFFFNGGTHLASLFNIKAKKWVAGRKHIFENLQKAIPPGEKIIWIHCASLGEFEQGKPILEKLKAQYPGFKIILTFFSPSGYEAQKDYKGADWIFYLPLDGPGNARRFLEIVHPSLVIFVKYEFWYYYLKKIKYRNIPLLLVSALFRKDMPFFKWYGGLQRKMLSRFDHLFVQNESSKKLMDKIGLADICSISGDTRFDRVIEIAEQWKPIPAVEQFLGDSKAIIAGSTWPEDEKVLQKAFSSIQHRSLKLVIAPHEINEKHIISIKGLFPNAVLFSEIETSNQQPITSNCLIIDNIGMLSRLYKYAAITYIGGGLRTMGVHNVLEAAVYFKPVLFGAYFRKYTEATELVMSGGGLPFNDEKRNGEMLKELIEVLLSNKEDYYFRCKTAGEFVQTNKGATQKIIQFIQEKRLLTN
jgi:3-deoxy-D-manno-octulosonic-acid transferase